MDAKQIIREHLDAVNQSKIIDIFMADQETLQSEMELAVRDIAKLSAKPEPPEPPKTVLPDMSDAEIGKVYWFFAEDGTQVSCFISLDGDMQWGVDDNWYKPDNFIKTFPHLGRLRRAVPGEVAE